MIIDQIGTELRGGHLRLASDRNRPLQWWMPQGERTTYVVRVYARRSARLVWQRPFVSLVDALMFQHGFALGDRRDCPSFDFKTDCFVYNTPEWLSVGSYVWWCPDGQLAERDLLNAVAGSFTASNSTAADWFTGNKAPAGVTATDYLVVAGGGAGGNSTGATSGGGGAGGYRTATALSVTPGTAYTITVGAGGATADTNGANSVFSSITSTGGGAGSANSGANGGSGGGGGNGTGGAGGTGTGGQGNNGGASSGSSRGGGGGGAGAVGGAGSSGVAGAGGAGTASSITGASVTYAGGGGGGKNSGDTGGGGGAGGGGAGGTGAGAGTAGTANTGGGGGGSFNGAAAGAGGSGIVALSYTVVSVGGFNMPMMGM